MGELLAVPCDACGEPMVPNVSTLDEDGCGWICLNPGCPELAAGELEAEDLVEAGVPEGLADRLARLVDHYVDALEGAGEAAVHERVRELAKVDLAHLRTHLRELRHLAQGAGALSTRISDGLVISYSSDEFTDVETTRQTLAAVTALCGALHRTAADAQERLAGVDPQVPGLVSPDRL